MSVLSLMITSASALAEFPQPVSVSLAPWSKSDTVSAVNSDPVVSAEQTLQTPPRDTSLPAESMDSVTPVSQLSDSAVESSDPVNDSSQLSPTEPTADPMDSMMSVTQLSDVQPTDWAFQALQSLVNRYSCVVGYPDSTYRGNQALSRCEFAAGLNACLDRVNQLINTGTAESVTKEDLATVRRLEEEFSAELANLRNQLDRLESRTAQLEGYRFSPTTKLTGLTIFAVNAGGFSGERIIAPTGIEITDEDPNPSVISRASFNFNTSFFGTDLLQVRLIAGSDGTNDNAAGFLEPNFGSVLDFSVQGRDNDIGIARLYYSFNAFKDLRVTIGSAMTAPDFVDKNSYANNSVRDFSTQALVNNFILFPRPGGAGTAVEWHPGKGPVKLRAVYIAANASRGDLDSQRFIGGPSAPILIFPNQGGEGGLFGDPHQGVVELEYSPSKAFAVRLQYSGGEVFDSNFDAFGVNFELALSPQVGIFGRYGYSEYPNTFQGDIHPNYWMAGVGFRDVLIKGDVGGIAAGQPFIENAVGNGTQTNFEAFYNLPINDSIRITPLIQLITDAGNQSSNGTILTGTLRTVFSF